jgi:hypothetical protein
MDLTEDEYYDLQEHVFELIDFYIQHNAILMHSPNFDEELILQISDYIYTDFLELELCDETFDYDEFCDLIDIMTEYFFEIFEQEFPKRSYICTSVNILPDIPIISNKIEIIKNIYQPTQRTPEWYEFRHNLMTASNIWKIFKSDSQINSIIYEKCKPFDPSSSDKYNWAAGGSLQWGTTYEFVSIQLYETLFSTKIQEFGCVRHPKYDCIGASPDGINIDPTSDRYGRMIEVKNIVNREITSIPKEEYWIQMQIQMETCDLDECDFIETRFKEYTSETEFYEDTIVEWKGIILCFIQKHAYNSKPLYKYSPIINNLGQDTNNETFRNWVSNTIVEFQNDFMLYKTQYWYLDEFSCILVKRNKLWFQHAVPKILETWKIIKIEKETGYEHRMAKKKIVTPNSNIFMEISADESSHILYNIPVKNDFGLIKLDHI